MSGQAVRVGGAALALLAAVALAAGAVALLTGGDDAAQVRIVAPEPTATAAAAPTATDIRVQVSGAVMSPGVYSMNNGDRVMDAIAAAGGVDPGADLSGINLALRVQDEAHYHIPTVGETPPPSPAGASSTSPRTGGRGTNFTTNLLIDLNTASAQGLESLPGIGPVMAGRIVAHREVNGPFAAVDDVQDVPGIGPKTLESIRSLVTVSGEP